MTDKATFEKPDPEEDRLRPGKIMLIGVLGFAVGFGIIWLREGGHRLATVFHEDDAPALNPAAHEEAAARLAAPDDEAAREETDVAENAVDAAVAPALDTLSAIHTDSPLANAVGSAGTPGPSTGIQNAASAPAAPVSTHVGAFERGRIAYLRCEGMPGGDEDCPRDSAMEDEVWRVLETLPRCATPPTGSGDGDVRLEFTRGGSTDVSIRARAEDRAPHLDGARILDCVAGQLSHVQTSIRASRVITSFRFRMQ